MTNNITAHNFLISKNERNLLNGHNSFVIWFTGLSGSGKSTIANEVEVKLFEQKVRTYTLDGDNIRKGLNAGLGFSKEDRKENLRRIAEVSKLFVEAGTVVVASFISPLKDDRDLVKNIIGEENFLEIYVNTSLEVCEQRDVKGLYKKARAGEIMNFTGVSSPYEAPVNPDIEIKTEEETVDVSASRIVDFLKGKLEIKKHE